MLGKSVIGKMVATVISAAGHGQVPDGCLAELVPGKPVISALVDRIYEAGMREAIIVLNPDNVDKVRPYLPKDVHVVIQETQKGTAQAVKLALKYIDKPHIMSIFADMPLWRSQTLFEFAKKHILSDKKMTMMLIPESIWDDSGERKYGRLAKDADGNILGIFESYECLPSETDLTAVNTSLFCFYREALIPAIRNIQRVTDKGEKTINFAADHFLEDKSIGEFLLTDPTEAYGINNLEQLENARKVFQKRQLAMAS